MANVWTICRRELSGYFGTPIAYVFLAIFVFLRGIFAIRHKNACLRSSDNAEGASTCIALRRRRGSTTARSFGRLRRAAHPGGRRRKEPAGLRRPRALF